MKAAVLIRFGLGIGDYTGEPNPKGFAVPHLGDIMVVDDMQEEGFSVISKMERPDGSEIYPHLIDPKSFKVLK